MYLHKGTWLLFRNYQNMFPIYRDTDKNENL